MATRTLEVKITGDAAALDRTLRSIDSSAKSRFSSMANAAKVAGVAITAGLGYGAKASIDAAREAREVNEQIAAAIKSTGGEANITAREIDRLASSLQTKTRIDDEAIKAAQSQLLTFTEIHNEVGRGNKIFDRASLAVLDVSTRMGTDASSAALQLGKALNDPIAGLSALSRSGIQFTEQQKEQITTLVEGGDTLKAQKVILEELEQQFGGSAAAQGDSFDALKLKLDDLAESVGNRLLPVMDDASKEAGKFVKEIEKILDDDSLSGDEKANAIAKLFENVIDQGIDALGDAIPVIAEHAGELGLKAAEGLVEGFIKAPILGKLAISAWLISAFGGKGALTAAGGKLGTTIAAGLPSGMKAGIASAGGWGPVGITLAGVVGAAYAGANSGLGEKLAGLTSTTFQKALLEAADNVPVEELRQKLEVFSDGGQAITREMVVAWRMAGDVSEEGAERILRVIDRLNKSSFKDVNRGIASVGDSITDLALMGDRRLEQVDKAVNRAMTSASRSLDGFDDDLDRTADRTRDKTEDVDRSFDRLDAGVARALSSVSSSTIGVANVIADALRTIGENTNKALKAYGVKEISLSIADVAGNAGSATQGKQQGGDVFQVPGYGTGDSFPMMGQEGAFVLNRNAANAFFGLQRGGGVPLALEPGELYFGPEMAAQMGGALEWMNRAVKRQAGGALNFALGPYDIPPIAYDAAHAGGNSHVHATGTTTPWIVAVGKQLQSMGFLVSEHPAFGGVAPPPAHSLTGGHYDALAIDINSAASLNESRAEVAQIAKALGGSGAGGATVEKIKRLILEGPDGPLKSMGQGSLDMAWKAANKFIASKRPVVTGGDSGISADGNVEQVFAKVAKRLSTSKTATLALGMAGYAESGMQDLSYGDSTSLGSLQLLASTASSLGIDPHDEGAVSSHFLTKGYYTRGANESAAMGLPAHLAAQAAQGSAFSDGSNYLAQTGPAQSWMARYGLRGGGFVGMRGGGKSGKKKPNAPIPNLPVGKVRPGVLSYEQQMTQYDIALTIAEGTEGIEDDAAVLIDQGALISGQKSKVEDRLANIALSDREKKQIEKQAIDKTAKLEEKLRKGGLTPKEARRLAQERQGIEQKLRGEAIAEKRGGLLEDLSNLTSELASNSDALGSLTEATNDQSALIDAQNAAADEMKRLREAIEANSKIVTSELYIQRQEAVAAVASLISGEIGGRLSATEFVPGYGSVASA